MNKGKTWDLSPGLSTWTCSCNRSRSNIQGLLDYVIVVVVVVVVVV